MQTRGKTLTFVDNVNIMPSLGSYVWCSLHALATWAAMTNCIGNKMFPKFAAVTNKKSDSGQKIFNRTLKDVANFHSTDDDVTKPDNYSQGLTSHSVRSLGKALLMTQHKEICKEARDYRIAHNNLETVSKMKETHSAYFEMSYDMDAACGRALAGNEQGINHNTDSPYIYWLPITERVAFEQFTLQMFSSISTTDIHIRYLFSCILIIWFNECTLNEPDCGLTKKMINLNENIECCNLESWSTLLKQRFDFCYYVINIVLLTYKNYVLQYRGRCVGGNRDILVYSIIIN